MNDSRPGSADLAKRPDWLSGLLILGHTALVFGPLLVVVATPPGPLWLACFLWFGVTVHGLLNLLHECAHYHVFSGRAGSDVIGRWLLGPLVFTDFDAYRRRHWDHHRYLGGEGDTKDAYLSSISGRGLPLLLARCLSLRVAIRKWRLQTPGDADVLSRSVMVRTAIAQSILFAALLAASKLSGLSWIAAAQRTSVFYLLVVVYGLAAVAPFIASLRTIAEHQPGADGAPLEGRAALRNFRCGPASRLVFGAYGFGDHATHHLHPAVPAYRLPDVTKRNDPEGFAQRPTYLATLVMLAREPAGDSNATSLA